MIDWKIMRQSLAETAVIMVAATAMGLVFIAALVGVVALLTNWIAS